MRGFTSDTLREKLNYLLISDQNLSQKKFHIPGRKNTKNRKDAADYGEE